jgi:hypothetical protein
MLSFSGSDGARNRGMWPLSDGARNRGMWPLSFKGGDRGGNASLPGCDSTPALFQSIYPGGFQSTNRLHEIKSLFCGEHGSCSNPAVSTLIKDIMQYKSLSGQGSHGDGVH